MNPYADLLAGRLTSLNQVLDPWIYIILRRDSIVRVANWLRHQRQPKQVDNNSKRSNKSVIVLYSSRRSKTSFGDSESAKMCGSHCTNDDDLLPTSHI